MGGQCFKGWESPDCPHAISFPTAMRCKGADSITLQLGCPPAPKSGDSCKYGNVDNLVHSTSQIGAATLNAVCLSVCLPTCLPFCPPSMGKHHVDYGDYFQMSGYMFCHQFRVYDSRPLQFTVNRCSMENEYCISALICYRTLRLLIQLVFYR